MSAANCIWNDFFIFIIYVSRKLFDKKSVFRQLCLSKHECYRKTHKYIAFEIPIALRINDSRTNLLCQTKPYAPARVCFRQASLFAIRRLSGALTESNTDDAMHLYHDFYWISFFDDITNTPICQYFQSIYSWKKEKISWFRTSGRFFWYYVNFIYVLIRWFFDNIWINRWSKRVFQWR